MLSRIQLDLLGEILELTWKSGSLIEIVDFRATHAGHRSELDELVRRSLLAKDGGGLQYRVSVLGLDALGTPLSKTILTRGDVLARELQKRFLNKSLRLTPYLFSEVAKLWGITLEECRLTITHFRDVLSMWASALVNDFSSSEAGLLVGEGILDCPTVGALIAQLRAWQMPQTPRTVCEPAGNGHLPLTGHGTSLVVAWPAIRVSLQEFSFFEIKAIAGLAGLDLTQVAHLVQRAQKGSSKGELMSGVDASFGKMTDPDKKRFLTIITEEILRRRPDVQAQLEEHLSRLGWSFTNGILLPMQLLDPADLNETPAESRLDLLKAAQRFRDGDLSGAISAACGAVDSATCRVYEQMGLGDPTKSSFQERCRRASVAIGVVPEIEQQLEALGWLPNDIVPFKKNFESALNHGAYVMQTLRSRMGDVHGTKPILRTLVFDCLKWAELFTSSLMNRS